MTHKAEDRNNPFDENSECFPPLEADSSPCSTDGLSITLNFRGDPNKPHDICRSDYEKLSKAGFLWEFYPDAPYVFPTNERKVSRELYAIVNTDGDILWTRGGLKSPSRPMVYDYYYKAEQSLDNMWTPNVYNNDSEELEIKQIYPIQ